jgi:hypothetical protein
MNIRVTQTKPDHDHCILPRLGRPRILRFSSSFTIRERNLEILYFRSFAFHAWHTFSIDGHITRIHGEEDGYAATGYRSSHGRYRWEEIYDTLMT